MTGKYVRNTIHQSHNIGTKIKTSRCVRPWPSAAHCVARAMLAGEPAYSMVVACYSRNFMCASFPAADMKEYILQARVA